MAKDLKFPQRFALVCRLWGIQPSSAQMAEAMSVEAPTLSRWANFNVRSADAKKHPEGQMAVAFAKHLHASDVLPSRGYGLEEFRDAIANLDDKQFLQVLVARSLPASVRQLADNKFQQARNVLLPGGGTALFFLYRLGTFYDEDVASELGRDESLAGSPVLRRVPVAIEQYPGESFLTYRERYRSDVAIGSLFHVDSHFTVWGQDDNSTTSELFVIKIKRDKLAHGTFAGMFLCSILMLGDSDVITSCKALLRPVKNENNEPFEKFALETHKCILLQDDKEEGGYKIAAGCEPTEEAQYGATSYEKIADFLSIKSDRAEVVLR